MPLSVNKVKIRLTQTYLGEEGVIGSPVNFLLQLFSNSPEFY